MRRSLTVIAGIALLLPTAGLGAPAEAGTEASSATIKNCAKTKQDVTVRITLSDNGKFTRVRISHPKGKGNFREPRLHHVTGSTSWYSAPPPDDQGRAIAGGAIDRKHRLKPSFRTISVSDGFSSTSVSAKFKLDSGKTIKLGCSLG